MQQSFPKVLIISSNALSLHVSNGKTYHSFFDGWPAESIAQLYFQDEIPESNKFNQFFRIRDIDVIRRIFCLKKSCGNILLPQVSNKSPENTPDKTGRLKKIIASAFRSNQNILTIVRNQLYKGQTWDSPDLNSWISNFEPEIIFFVGGPFWFPYEITYKLAGRFNIPFTIYLTDDYFIYNKGKGLLGRYVHTDLGKRFKKYIDAAAHLFVIGEQMGKVYNLKYYKTFSTLINAVDMPQRIPESSRIKNNPIIFRYIGGLHLNRWKSIVKLGVLLEELEWEYVLEVYSLTIPEKLILQEFRKHNVAYCGALYGADVKKKMSEADFLIHAESDDPKYRQVTHLSVSTKIPEYFVTKRCLIAIGPKDIASIKLVEDNGLGVVIGHDEEKGSAVKKLRQVIEDEAIYESITIKAVDYAYDHLNGIKMRKELLAKLGEHVHKNSI